MKHFQPTLRLPQRRFRLRFTCEGCTLFDDQKESCATEGLTLARLE